MRLMKLAPEIVRLRRVAKAYAAGEFSRREYRDARREVIENFRADPFDQDDTRRRVAASSGLASPSQEVPVAVDSRWPKLWVSMVLLVTMLLIVNFAFAARIVPVSERDPNPATSPRFQVREVQLEDFKPYPGIELEFVQARIVDALNSVRQRDAVGPHGFTETELVEVGRFLKAVGVHSGQSELTVADARDLAGLIQSQKERRGVSLVQLQEVAASVQTLYREQGYFLALAFVPSQEITDGVVYLRVLPGTLGSIAVSGDNSSFVVARFADVLGQPVTHQLVDERLYELNRLPGFVAQAAFEPGSEVGETRLKLNVLEQLTWSTRAWIDNHGDEATGQERITVAGSWLNPFGRGDVVSAGLMASVNPRNQTFGYLEYATPLGGRDQLSVRVASNDFISERATELKGDAVFVDLTATRALHRTRSESLTVGFGINHHTLSWDGGPKQKVAFLEGLLSGHRVWDEPRISADARFSLAAGHIGNDIFAGQEKVFVRVSFDALAWTPVDLPVLAGEQKLAIKILGQLTDTQLPASLRLGLGGAGQTRGFSRDSLLVDRGVIVGLDLRIPLNLGELSLFADSAYGEGRNQLQPFWGHVTSAGIGWDADIGRNIVSRMSWAMPVAAKGTGGLEDEGPRFYWSLRYER